MSKQAPMTRPIEDSGYLKLTAQIPLASKIDLSNKIHRVYGRERFAEPFNYQFLKPILQLATQLLRKSKPYFYTAFASSPQYLGKLSGSERPVWEYPEPPTKLTAEQERFVDERLDVLADNISFSLADHEGADGKTRASREEPKRGIEGYPAIITLSRTRYGNLLDLWAHKHDRSPMMWCYLVFIIANVLNHELFHAALEIITPRGAPGGENFFGPSARTTEEGCELEVWLYGGISSSSQSGSYRYGKWFDCVTPFFTFSDWPTTKFLNYYKGKIAVRGEGPPMEIRWAVPFSWFNKLLTNKFWQDEEAGLATLKIDRAYGYRYTNDGQPYPRTYDDDMTAFLPEGYRSTKEGLVVKIVKSSGLTPDAHIPARSRRPSRPRSSHRTEASQLELRRDSDQEAVVAELCPLCFDAKKTANHAAECSMTDTTILDAQLIRQALEGRRGSRQGNRSSVGSESSIDAELRELVGRAAALRDRL